METIKNVKITYLDPTCVTISSFEMPVSGHDEIAPGRIAITSDKDELLGYIKVYNTGFIELID